MKGKTLKEFRVTATVSVYCSRVVNALDEEDALEQCEGISGNEWIEGFTVERDSVELEYANPVKPPKKAKVRQ